jgi:hypothetical protein
VQLAPTRWTDGRTWLVAFVCICRLFARGDRCALAASPPLLLSVVVAIVDAHKPIQQHDGLSKTSFTFDSFFKRALQRAAVQEKELNAKKTVCFVSVKLFV